MSYFSMVLGSTFFFLDNHGCVGDRASLCASRLILEGPEVNIQIELVTTCKVRFDSSKNGKCKCKLLTNDQDIHLLSCLLVFH